MTPTSFLRQAAFAGALTAAAPATFAAPPPEPAAASAAASPDALVFAGTRYVHRWSKAGLNEYTPPAQADLDHWDDMVTVLVYDQVRTEDDLALVASRLLAKYQRVGVLLRGRAAPGTAQRPTEHLIVAIVPGGGIVETVFTRLRMAGDVGEALICAHRFYGDRAASEASADWVGANGQRVEDALRAWQDAPSPDALRTLPQAR